MEACREAGYTPFDKYATAARAAALGRRTTAVIIAARPAPKSGDLSLSSSSSSSSPSSSQPTPRTQPSASARKTQAAHLTVRSATAAESLPSSSSAIYPALRAHHNRKLFESSYVARHCYFEAQAASNKLTHGMEEKQGSKLMRSLYADFCSGSITQLWLLRDWLDRTERQKLPGYTAATAEAEDALERAAALALKRVVVSTHWAWGGDEFFMKRSRMMRTINCNQVSSSLWEFNIGLDSDEFSLMMLHPLMATSGVILW